MRTSQSHPIIIAQIKSGPGYGNIGLTFCPGKVQAQSSSGSWFRDLAVDLDTIERWGASAIVSLIEDNELCALGVTDMAAQVRARHMQWYHLPIADAGVPDASFEALWAEVGEGLRSRLRDGANVLVHCKGGLGRAGTVAARLLVELGWDPSAAIEGVRNVRPGAIETRAQAKHVMRASPVPERASSKSLAASEDRATGALLGLAIGDAIGTSLEFRARDSYPAITDMIGGGPFDLKAGEWTDDTSMALALADSLLVCNELDEADLMERFCSWHEAGAYSVLGYCFDIGLTTRQALARWKQTGNPVAGSKASHTAGNGSLMRLAPVAVRHWRNREILCDVAARQSMVTHGAAPAVDACVALAEMLADAIAGKPRSEVLRDKKTVYCREIADIVAGSWRGKHRPEIASSGYVVHSLEAALWCVSRTSSFAQAVLMAANLGDDADTTAAITGQLAGAIYGSSKMPAAWLDRLAWKDEIVNRAKALFSQSRTGLLTDDGTRRFICKVKG